MSTKTVECEENQFSPLHLDALKEIGNIGAAHASTALTNLVHSEVMIDVPDCFVCRVEDLPSAFGNVAQEVVAVYLGAVGKEQGAILIVFPIKMAKGLSNVLLQREQDGSETMDEDDLAAMAEIGNISASAYLNAIASMIDTTMVPSPPGVALDMLGAIMQYPAQLVAEDYDYLVVIRTRFVHGQEAFPGFILYIPDKDSRRRLMEKFGLE